MRVTHAAAILVVMGLLAGCSREQPDPAETASIAAGARLFEDNCAQCHPRSGRGDYLKRIPATLLTRRAPFELIEWIRGRDEHREMPSFDHLTDEETRQLADYLYSQIGR